jgi:hypothetical protein
MDHDLQPKGTMVILVIFLVIIIVSWSLVYLLMLQRIGG